MVNRVPSITLTRPLVDKSGIATQDLRSWLVSVGIQLTITGAGSPEGVIEAEVTAEYMDTTGATGSVKYIKRDADNGLGDKRFGWVLI